MEDEETPTLKFLANGQLSPPKKHSHRRNRSIHVPLKVLDIPQEFVRKTLGTVTQDDAAIQKPVIKNILRETPVFELLQLTQRKFDLFTPKTIEWLLAWANRDYELQLTRASAITLAHLAFPEERIPELRSKIFQSTIHTITQFEGFIVMPKAKNLSLDDALRAHVLTDWDWKMKMRVVTQIVGAMRTLHQYGIMHRDLKPANILLDEDYNCYLADFGISRNPKGHRKRSMTMNVGTSMYMAPELSEGDGLYGEQIDVFSFGTMLWQIASNCAVPYVDQGIPLRDIPKFVNSGKRLEIPDDCPPFAADLITKCWNHNPKKRPSFATILESIRTQV